jgi:hypothetical protein
LSFAQDSWLNQHLLKDGTCLRIIIKLSDRRQCQNSFCERQMAFNSAKSQSAARVKAKVLVLDS